MDYLSPSGNVAIRGDVDVVNGPTLYGSTMFKYNQRFKFGLEVSYLSNKTLLCLLHFRVFSDVVFHQTRYNTHYEEKQDTSPELIDLNFGGAYMCSDWTFSARTTDLLENVRLSYVHHVAHDLDVSYILHLDTTP